MLILMGVFAWEMRQRIWRGCRGSYSSLRWFECALKRRGYMNKKNSECELGLVVFGVISCIAYSTALVEITIRNCDANPHDSLGRHADKEGGLCRASAVSKLGSRQIDAVIVIS